MTTKKQPQQKPAPAKISDAAIEGWNAANVVPEFKPYDPLPGVVPDNQAGKNALAMDTTPYDLVNNADYFDINAAYFIGYPALATMAQSVEYYNMAQVMADEMVRNWITIHSTEDDDELIEQLETLLVKYDIKRLMHQAVVQDSTFGVCHIYIDTDASDEEIQNPLIMDPRSIKKGTKLGFRTVDPTWVYPAMYNTSKPLRADFYKPKQWFVMGQIVHESRFIDIISRPVPDILKPSYNFGGMSLTQFMMPYVKDWHAMKKNVVAVVKTLRMRVLKTDLDARLQNPGEFDRRAKLFTKHQDNFGLWVVNTEEELEHHQTSLGELSALLSNYQEQLCIPARTTNLKLLGNPPAGLSASGDSEVETWHETISGLQEGLRHALENIIKIIQLAEFGEIHEHLYFEFNPLDEITEEERANINKVKVETVALASDSQLISPEEGRETLSMIDGAGFEGIDVSELPEQTEEEEQWPEN